MTSFCSSLQCWQRVPCAAHEHDVQPSPPVRVVAPGFVFMQGVLSPSEQLFWAEYAMYVGNLPAQPFFHIINGNRMLNNGNRGRIYGSVHSYPSPDQVLKLCHRLIDLAREKDSALPVMTPTHLLLNLYKSTAGMMWHADDDENDGDNDHPIVSISIGADCDFGYEIDGQETTLKLRSGDVLIWGGPQRMLRHAVQKVYPLTCPPYLTPLSKERLNFTFRDSPNMIGKEAPWQIEPP